MSALHAEFTAVLEGMVVRTKRSWSRMAASIRRLPRLCEIQERTPDPRDPFENDFGRRRSFAPDSRLRAAP